jgi:hypothetical protein
LDWEKSVREREEEERVGEEGEESIKRVDTSCWHCCCYVVGRRLVEQHSLLIRLVSVLCLLSSASSFCALSFFYPLPPFCLLSLPRSSIHLLIP